MTEDNSKLLEIFHLTWPNLTRRTPVINKMKRMNYDEENDIKNEKI
jgi:hypothetical protein